MLARKYFMSYVILVSVIRFAAFDLNMQQGNQG